MDVPYNLGQLIICLETWLGTHEKNLAKRTLTRKGPRKPKRLFAFFCN
jgi:hypothetical protein